MMILSSSLVFMAVLLRSTLIGANSVLQVDQHCQEKPTIPPPSPSRPTPLVVLCRCDALEIPRSHQEQVTMVIGDPHASVCKKNTTSKARIADARPRSLHSAGASCIVRYVEDLWVLAYSQYTRTDLSDSARACVVLKAVSHLQDFLTTQSFFLLSSSAIPCTCGTSR
jgi:hypothetical protein